MGLAFAAGPVRRLVARAGERTGVDLQRLLERGGPAWGRTEVVQPLLVAVCLGIHEELRSRGVQPHFVAGLSLGELTAWSASGAISHEEAVDLAAQRGRLMGDAAAKRPGAMSMVQAPTREQAEEALALGRTAGALELAGRDAPAEWVLSGDPAALTRVASRFSCRPLSVAGAWHSPAMAGALEPWSEALRALRPRAASAVLVSSGESPAPSQIAELLARQLVAPFDWAATLATLAREGAVAFVTVGPGRVLRSLVRKNLGEGARVFSAEQPADLDLLVEALRA